MHSPPATAWKLGPAGWQRVALAALGLLSVLLWVGFCLVQGWAPGSQISLAVLCICMAIATTGLRNAPQGSLRWDGAQWHWSGQQNCAVRRVVCALDLQRYVLLQIDCEHGPRLWLWLQSRSMDAPWMALRRAWVASAAASSESVTRSLPH